MSYIWLYTKRTAVTQVPVPDTRAQTDATFFERALIGRIVHSGVRLGAIAVFEEQGGQEGHLIHRAGSDVVSTTGEKMKFTDPPTDRRTPE